METKDIFQYIQEQEAAYKRSIRLGDAWNWSMAEHIKTSFLYKNSQLLNGKDEFTPVKNITRPILNLQKRSEDIDVKDVQPYVDAKNCRHLSFLFKKYHDDIFVQEFDLDMFFDSLNESRIDYGAGLSKKIGKGQREVVPLQSIVFCDQTDLLSGPIALKHYYSPGQLMAMAANGWGNAERGATATLKEAIELSRKIKRDNKDQQQTDTPGKYIEIYEVHGNMPKSFRDKSDTSGEYEDQFFIGCFYQKVNGEKGNITLFHMPERKSPFKLIKRDDVYGRALGFGGAEELFEAQVWVNYDMIRMQKMLDAAAVTILGATGSTASILAKSNVRDAKNLTVFDLGGDGDLKQIDTFPRNMALFERSVAEWEAHAQQMGSANDAILGKSPAAGTPFKLQELVTDESHGLHDFRRGQFAKHLEEIYRDDFIPYIQSKICEGTTFLSELTLEEMQYVTDCLVTNQIAHEQNERVLNGQLVMGEQEKAQFEESVRNGMKQAGNKHVIEILKGEFKDKPLAIKINIAGKQKNLAAMTDKVVNILRFAFQNPVGFAQTMQIPGMASAFNDVLEFSGLSAVDFSGIDKIAEKMAAQAQPTPSAPPAPIAA